MQKEHSLATGVKYGRKPYTYLIHHILSGKKYYGVRFCKGCTPTDLWTTYFSSSKEVHRLIQQFGVESFEVEIRKQFNTVDEAIRWEGKILRRINARKRADFLNKHNNDSLIGLSGDLNPMRNSQHLARWKISAKGNKKGRKLSSLHREAISKSLKGHEVTDKTRAAISNSLKGIKRDEAYKERCRQQRLGKKSSIESSEKKRLAIKGRKKYMLNNEYKYYKPGEQPAGWLPVKK